TALLIGPPAAALRVTKTVPGALVTACLTGVAATWLGILLAYDSFYWGAGHQPLPVSFFIVAIIFVTYLAAGLPAALAARRTAAPSPPGAAARDQVAACPRTPPQRPGWRPDVRGLHDDHLAHRHDCRRRRRRCRLLRSAARRGVPRPRHPQRRLHRRGRRGAARHQYPHRPGRLLTPGRPQHRHPGPPRALRRRACPTPGPDTR